MSLYKSRYNNMFETLTKYIEQIKDIHSGQWVIDEENGGTP